MTIEEYKKARETFQNDLIALHKQRDEAIQQLCKLDEEIEVYHKLYKETLMMMLGK